MENDIEDAWDKLIYGKTSAEMGIFEPGTSARRVRLPSPEREQERIQHPDDMEYANKFRKEEEEKTLQAAKVSEDFENCRKKHQGAGMSMLEDDSTICGDLFTALDLDSIEVKASVYNNYSFDPPVRKPLKIDEKKSDILELLKKENAIVVRGFTGCGKTTQVPQFILDECYRTRTPCNIVVTQPRRIAAISIAKRVCEERKWKLGTVVGYQVGMERQAQPFTCLTYMTTGCLLESLIGKKSLQGYTHIIVDEVHERDEDTDLLLLVVRKFMRHTLNSVKVILMSATADADKFSQYFSTPVKGSFRNAPIVEVDETRLPYDVREYYLNDLRREKLSYLKVPSDKELNMESIEPRVLKELYEPTALLISALDEKREKQRCGIHSVHKHLSSARGAVLIFLPGVGEIESMHKFLQDFDSKAIKKNFWHILPLHSRITSEEQSRVFEPISSLHPHFGHYRKIILSTNIAESSLTVPDIVYVIDFCLVKQLVTDQVTNFCSLKTDWAAKSSCIQRKGRVGRVDEGVVYRMITKDFYENHLRADVTPEILRCPLEQAVLRVKLLDLGEEPQALLALVIDPPSLNSIARTILTLKEIGALFITVGGKLTPLDGDLTFLGRVISRLPIDVRFGKLVILGYMFNILEECITMAAGMSSKNIFTSPFKDRLLAYQVKMSWSEGSFSDPITILNAYQKFKCLEQAEYFKRSGETPKNQKRHWANANFIELKALNEMDNLVKEIKHRLVREGIEEQNGPNVKPLTENQKALLLRVVIFGAFYPNYFTRDAVSHLIDEREAVKSLCGLDPFSTIKLQGFPNDQPTKPYVRQIKNHMNEIFKMLKEDTWNTKITFDSQRVFVQFHQEGNPTQRKKLPGKIPLPIYLALKQKQLGYSFSIELQEKRDAEQYSHKLEESAKQFYNPSDLESVSSTMSGLSDIPLLLQIPPPRLPELHENELEIGVTHVEEPNHFWAQRVDDTAKRAYKHILEIIGERGSRLERFVSRQQHNSTLEVKTGNLVMGPYENEYYRAKVLSGTENGMVQTVRLYFIDFGNAGEAHVSQLRQIPPVLMKFPPLAMECRLTGIAPSLISDSKGRWSVESKHFFEGLTIDKLVTAKVFSVVNGITTLDLKPKAGSWDNPISQQLLNFKNRDQNPCAVKVEESFCSKMDNEERRNFQQSGAQSKSQLVRYQKEHEADKTAAIELLATEMIPFTRSRNSKLQKLKGPYSPLEMRMFGKVRALVSNTVKIENDSVNSVMMDDQPGDKHERVLIAAHVGTNLNGNCAMARSTTLLPNIASLPTILTLLFAPRVEFRTDAKRTRLVGAICGLGYDRKKNQPLYNEHDMEIAFDTEIDSSDVYLINKARFWMDSVLGVKSYGSPIAPPSKQRMLEMSQKTLNLLFELIAKPRKDAKEVVVTNNFKWNQVLPEHVVYSDVPDSQLNTLIPLHDLVKLVP